MVYTLGLVQAEQASIDLPRDRVGVQEIVKQPLGAETGDAGVKDAYIERAEIAGLVQRHEEVFDGERVQVNVVRLGGAPSLAWIVGPIRVPKHMSAVDNAADTAHIHCVQEPASIEPARETQLHVDRVDVQLKHGKVGARIAFDLVLVVERLHHMIARIVGGDRRLGAQLHRHARRDGIVSVLGMQLDGIGRLGAPRNHHVLETDAPLFPLGDDRTAEYDREAHLPGQDLGQLQRNPLLHVQQA